MYGSTVISAFDVVIGRISSLFDSKTALIKHRQVERGCSPFCLVTQAMSIQRLLEDL